MITNGVAIQITLNRWLKFIEITTTTTSPGLGPQIRRRAELFSDLNRALQKEGFLKVVYVDNRRLEKIFSLPQVNETATLMKSDLSILLKGFLLILEHFSSVEDVHARVFCIRDAE